MTESVECVVIGAGVVGLAVGRELAMQGIETIVLEQASLIGSGISSRNSEVIHAGIYYPPGSLKASLCVEGKHRLYAYCDDNGIDYQRCGKLIVATNQEQLAELERLQRQAAQNGVYDLQFLTAGEARALEPALHCVGALLSPSTGIIDSHGLMLQLQADLERAAGVVVFESPVERGECKPDGILLNVGGREPTSLKARYVVNCAGLHAQAVAACLTGLTADSIPPLHLAKGNYFSLSGHAPFNRLIYPIPQPGGLGVHLTLDLGGSARFGPDVQWVTEEDYRVEPSRADGFYAQIRQYWPDLPDQGLAPAYAGIRPKLHAPGGGPCDFMIQTEAQHGVSGLVNFYGIESPGLTSSLAIAREVVSRLLD